MGGAVSGFTKALARERPDALVKVVDFEPSRKTAALADLLVEETRRDPGAVEVGHADGRRWSVGVAEEHVHADLARPLTPETVFLVTGAAGSIVAAIVTDLAACGGTFHLLDLVDAPDPGDADLERFTADRDGLKHDLAARITARGERATPVLVERELARIERSRAALDAIRAVEGSGGTVHWHQVDLTDAGAVRAAVGDALAASERVDVLLHCAGLEISHFLPDKPQREFDLVFDVKADGWFHLLHALGDAEIGAAVVFSSIAGRFGNGGQTDYAAANDLLCKSVSSFRNARPATRGIAIDWTAWAAIGMASRGSIPKMMAFAGIDMLPPEHGVPVVRRELTATGRGGEVVVAGALGILLDEHAPAGGLDPEAAAGLVPEGEAGPMVGRPVACTLAEGLTVEVTLDPEEQPFLHDHRIDGTPVLPGVMGIEAFAEAAHLLAPDLVVTAVTDVDFLAPFKFFRDEPRTVEVQARLRDGGDGGIVADCRLIGRRTLPGQDEQATVHFRGTVRLDPERPTLPAAAVPPAGPEEAVGADDIYRVYFHGPAYQVLARAWGASPTYGALAADLPANHHPSSVPLIMAPRLVELCFQTSGVGELGTSGRMALPTHLDRLVAVPGAAESVGLTAVATPRTDGSGTDVEVVDAEGAVRVRLEGYRTIELPGGLDDDSLAPLRRAAGAT